MSKLGGRRPRPEPRGLLSRTKSGNKLLLTWACSPPLAPQILRLRRKDQRLASLQGPFHSYTSCDMRRILLREREAGGGLGKPGSKTLLMPWLGERGSDLNVNIPWPQITESRSRASPHLLQLSSRSCRVSLQELGQRPGLSDDLLQLPLGSRVPPCGAICQLS